MSTIRFQPASKALFSRRARGGLRRRPSIRLGLEILEDRLAPATWTGAGVLANNGGPDPSWSNASNWIDGLPTDPNAQLYFRTSNFNNAAVTHFTSNNDINGLSILSLQFEEDNPYNITGFPITLTTSLTVFNGRGSHTVGIPLSLSGNGVGFNIITPEATVTLSGGISSSGGTALNKDGSGTLVLTTANPNFAGSVNVNVGVLQVNDAQALGPAMTPPGSLSNGDTAISNDATATLKLSAGANNGTEVIHTSGKIFVDSTITWNGLIDLNFDCATIRVDGAGSTLTLAGGLRSAAASTGNANDLLKLGAGRLTLPPPPPNISFAGGEVAEGVLTFQGNYNVGSLFVDAGAAVEVQGNITVNAGTLTLFGTGVGGAGAFLNVSGTNTWSGNITLVGAATIGMAAGTGVVSGIISGAANATRPCGSGTITGGAILLGALAKVGPGTLILSGSNTYGDGTTISAGVLQVGNGGTTGTLGSGAVIDNASLIFNRSNAFTFANNISGIGSLTKNNTNTLTLSSNNTYGGITTINAGVLQVGNGGTTGTLGSGAVIDNASLIFDRSNAVTVANNISGTGSLTKNNTNILTLSGNNTYSGATAINQGQLNATGGNAIGNTSAVSMAAGTVLNIQSAETIGSLASAAANAIVILASALTTGGDNTSTTFAGSITGGSGLTKTGTGTQTLSGTVVNDYTGSTMVAQGVLNVQKASALGSITAGTTVANNGAALQVQGSVSFDAEPLTLIGTGVGETGAILNVGGSNTWQGDISLAAAVGTIASSAGTLTLGGAVNTNGRQLLLAGAGNLVFGGNYVLSGGGLLNVNGNHTWAGNITLGSATTIGSSGGTLTVTGNIDNAGFLLTVPEAGNTTFGGAGVLSGTGGLTKSDLGRLTLEGTGINTYSGKTFINGGVVNIRKASALGDPAAATVVSLVTGVLTSLEMEGGITVNDEHLTLNGFGGRNQGALRNVSGTNKWTGPITLGSDTLVAVPLGQLILSGAIGAAQAPFGFPQPNPTLTKNFDGILTLSDVGSYFNQTFAGAGKLEVNGALASSRLVINSTGTLSGSGSVDGITTQGGTIDPGSKIGNVLTSTADVQFDANSTFNVLVIPVPNRPFDQLAVTGTVNLANARLTLNLTFLTVTQPGLTFRIIDNDGTDAVTGTFANLPEGLTFGVPVVGFLNGQQVVQTQVYRITYGKHDGSTDNDVILTYLGTNSAFANRSVTTPINEGEIATVTGTIIEPDPLDTFTLEVAWGDGTPSETYTFPAGSGGQTVSVPHRYLYNPASTSTDAYTIGLAWHDQNGVGNTGTLVVTVNSITAEAASRFVHEMYAAVLSREPDAAGQEFWAQQLQTGTTRSQLAKDFLESPEHRGIQVDGFYQTYLHRAADSAGRVVWVNGLLAGLSETEVVGRFLASPEYTSLFPTYATFLVGLYADVVGRAPDPEGLAFWQQVPQSAQTRSAVALGFLTSAEKYRQLVDDYYTTFLKRDADVQGEENWLAELLSSRLSPEQVALHFLTSEEFFVRATAAATP